MEWNELTAFVAVADTGSFSRAAEQLHLTQPAITKRLQALEAGIGVSLFDRVGKRVYLTDAGTSAAAARAGAARRVGRHRS